MGARSVPCGTCQRSALRAGVGEGWSRAVGESGLGSLTPRGNTLPWRFTQVTSRGQLVSATPWRGLCGLHPALLCLLSHSIAGGRVVGCVRGVSAGLRPGPVRPPAPRVLTVPRPVSRGAGEGRVEVILSPEQKPHGPPEGRGHQHESACGAPPLGPEPWAYNRGRR